MIELMVVVVIMAVLASLAAPSFRTFIISQRLKTASFDLYSSLLFARSEAVKRPNGTVQITPTDVTNWASGWTVDFVPKGGAVATLRQQDAVRDIAIFSTPLVSSLPNNSFIFGHDGRPNASVVFSLNATGFPEIKGRCVSANPGGGLATKVQPVGGC